NAQREAIDALLVTRGGGSLEDLWAFNDRAVAQAVRECSVPVVAAIGHETDVTIVELVADARASTPTQAAMLLTPDREALRQELQQNGRRLYLTVKRDLGGLRDGVSGDVRRLTAGVRQRVAGAQSSLARLAARLERCRPATLHAKRCAAVQLATTRIEAALRARLRESRHASAGTGERLLAAQRAAMSAAAQRLTSASRQLGLIGPVSVLRRGYSVTYAADGRVVRGPQDVKSGDALVTRLAEGRIDSTVGKSQGAPLPRAAPRRRKPIDDGSGGLFDPA
ncbi:MAG TPA: exodeoxyribonuclease VII large subunit, partial [Phycisphaerales bacterium]|nr:exodeoxyribonuclease VII large subunit [Phycisphaerales bacterium]